MTQTHPMETNGGLREGSFAVDTEAHDRVVNDEWPDDERVPLVVVVDILPLPANAVHIDALGKTVYEVNTGYSPQADVARVAYVDSLDAYAGAVWKTWDADEFVVKLGEYGAEWSIPVQRVLYDFPAPRLRDVGRIGEMEVDEAREKAITHLRWLAAQNGGDDDE